VARPPALLRFWGVIPVAMMVLLLGFRALVHMDPLDKLAQVPPEPGDPPGTTAYAGSLHVARGGSIRIGFQSPNGPGRLVVAGRELNGRGITTDDWVLPPGAVAIHASLPDGARLLWSPVGRHGSPSEYVPSSSLSSEPPDRATFDRPGTALLDGTVAMGLLLTVTGTFLCAHRGRLARVSRPTWTAIVVVFLVGLAVRWFDLDGAGTTWDEDVNWAAGRNYVSNVVSLDFRLTSWRWNHEHPPVMKYFAGIGAQLADGFGPARAISAVLMALACALLVPIGVRLYNLRTGIYAATIATLLPPLVAHGKIVGHEAPTMLWWSMGCLLALGVHDDLPVGRELSTVRIRLAVVGAAVGIAVASRFTNGLLGLLCAWIVVVTAAPRRRNATLAWGAALMPVAAMLTVYVVWPRLWGHPIAALSASFETLAIPRPREPFLGVMTRDPGKAYFFAYFVATLPSVVLAASVAWFARAIRDRDRAALVVVAWLVIPFGMVFSPVAQDGVRYVLPCFAAAAMMSAATLDALVTRLERRHPPSVVSWAVGAPVVLYLGLTDVHAHPYYLDYFAEHTGGASNVAARHWFDTAWWGEGLGPAVAYVNEHAERGARVSRQCIQPDHLATFREDLSTHKGIDRLDTWFVVYAPHRSCPVPVDAEAVFEVAHNGLILSRVYRR
jgi:4-amino-4-deoxy-L-arabinose transferase-like glycosyltransferase